VAADTLVDSTNLHARARRTLQRAEALIQKEAVPEACAIIGEAASIMPVSNSARVSQRIDGLRAQVTPWQRTKPVRELYEILTTYHRSARGNGKM
jgi:hypothetical protein